MTETVNIDRASVAKPKSAKIERRGKATVSASALVPHLDSRGKPFYREEAKALGTLQMSEAFRWLFCGWCIMAIATPSFAADPDHGKEIAKRWCASCHLVERGQTSATDQAPPFSYLARTPDFNANKLAFLLLQPHPNMPSLSLSRAEVADMADYILSLK